LCFLTKSFSYQQSIEALLRCEATESHIAQDGDKIHANASKHKAMSHECTLRAEKELEKETNALIRKAEILYAQQDRRYGKWIRLSAKGCLHRNKQLARHSQSSRQES